MSTINSTDFSDKDLIELDTEIMDSDTKAQDVALVPLEQNIFQEIGEDFDPIFKTVRIYGSVKEPLFVADDVKKLLGLTKIHYERDNFKEGFHKTVINISSDGRMRKMVAFTEAGLYLALMKSRSPLAEKFQIFVIVVIKRLRNEGSVTMEEAIRDYKKQLENLNWQLDNEHDKCVYFEKDRDRLFVLNSVNEVGRVLAEQKLEHNIPKDVIKAYERLKRFQKMYMKKIICYLVLPPEHLGCDYTVDELTTEEDLLYDENYIWTFSTKNIGKEDIKIFPIKEIWVHNKITTEVIMDKIKNNLYYESIKKSDGKEEYADYFTESLSNLDDLIDDINKTYEEKYEEEQKNKVDKKLMKKNKN